MMKPMPRLGSILGRCALSMSASFECNVLFNMHRTLDTRRAARVCVCVYIFILRLCLRNRLLDYPLQLRGLTRCTRTTFAWYCVLEPRLSALLDSKSICATTCWETFCHVETSCPRKIEKGPVLHCLHRGCTEGLENVRSSASGAWTPELC